MNHVSLSSPTVPLLARTYRRPDGTAVVELVAEPLAAAADATLAAAGLRRDDSDPSVTVGMTRARALGFPAWPVLTDPANADHAVAIAADLDWARRMASTKARDVQKRFTQLSADLAATVPGFVPTLLEELARIFDDAGNDTFARQYVGKAREAERAHNIPVDAARHREMLLEFVGRNLVSAKELSAEVSSSLARYNDPSDALGHVLEIMEAVARAGTPLYPAMVRDVRKVGKTAGLTPAQSDEALLDVVATAPGFLQAPEGFWKALGTRTRGYLSAHPEAAEYFATHRPEAFDLEDYLGLLDVVGQLDRMRGREDYPRWLVEHLVTARSGFTAPLPRYQAEIAGAASGVAALGTVNFNYLRVHPALLEVFVETGVTVCLGRDTTPWFETMGRVDMDDWLREPYGDLDVLARYSSPEASPLVSVNDAEILGKHLPELLSHQGTRRMLADWIAGVAQARTRFTGALPVLRSAVSTVLKPFADPRLVDLVPGEMAQLFAFDAAEEFAAAVRQGLLVEFTWPEFEEAFDRAVARTERAGSGRATVRETYPEVAIAAGGTIDILGAAGLERTVDGPPDGATVIAVYTVPRPGESTDTGVVLYYDANNRKWCQWFDESVPVPVDDPGFSWEEVTVPVADARMVGPQLLRAGDSLEHAREHSPFVWADEIRLTSAYGVVEYFSALTGERMAPSVRLDDDLEKAAAVGIEVATPTSPAVWPASRRLPLPDGNWADAPWANDGRYLEITGLDLTSTTSFGSHVNRIITPSGSVDTDPGLPALLRGFGEGLSGLLVLPGTGRSLNIARRGRASASGETGAILPWSRGVDGEVHAMHAVPDNLWFRPEVRDEAASARMRGYTADQARTLLTTLDGGDGGSSTGEDAAFRSVLATQLDCPEDVATALVHVARDARALEAEFTGCRTLAFGEDAASPPAAILPAAETVKDAPALPGAGLTRAGARAFYPDTLSRPEDLQQQARCLASWISAGKAVRGDSPSLRFMTRYLGREKLLAAWWNTACAAGHEGQDPVNAMAFARELVASGVLCNEWTVVTIAAPRDLPLREALFARDSGWIELGATVHPVCFQYYSTVPRPGCPVNLLLRKQDCHLLEAEAGVEILAGPVDSSDQLDAGEFLALLDDAESSLSTDREVDATQVDRLVRRTALPSPTARLLLGGVRADLGLLGGDSDLRFRDQDALPRYGLTTREVDMALMQVVALGEDLVDRLTMSILDRDSPAEGMADRWDRETGGAQALELTDREWERVYAATTTFEEETAVGELTRILVLGDRDIGHAPATLAGLLAVVAEMGLDDPRRPLIAEVFRMLRTSATEYVEAPVNQEEIGTMDLGSSVDDPAFTETATLGSQSVRILAEGLLDSLIDDLDTVYADRPGQVNDPAVAVPDLVDQVTETMGVGQDAARYLLQLLALPTPTDADVRAWNGWRKKDIDAAGDELAAGGLVVSAKRAGAARRYFLPGGWLEGRGGQFASRPVEVWKAPMYLMWQDAKARPIIKGCPPHVPVPELFRTSWQRYSSGDVPGYEELTTTRYRRR